jgi:cell division protein FtsW (lipid II flippase)
VLPFIQKFADVILNPIIILLFAIAGLYMVYSVIRFLSITDDKSPKRAEARGAMMWGIVGIVVMLSVYGLINFVLNTIGVNKNDPSLVNTINIIQR